MPTMRTLSPMVLSLLVLAAPAWAQLQSLQTEVVVNGLTFPVAFVQDPTQSNVQFIVEQGGRIRVLRDGQLLAQDFLDLQGQVVAGGEQGLLGLAFAPDYAVSRRFYVNFTNLSGHTVIARFLRSATDPVVADASSRFDFLWPDGNRFITQPFSNHNGGDLQFGSDNNLYIAMGDGGSANDPNNNAQNPATLLGKMLRLNVNVPDSDPEGYDAPIDNPFLGGASTTDDLIWAFGLRNPFRFTVDAVARGGTGALIISDVGQNAWEEVNYEPFGQGGRNYGWRIREGAHDNVTTEPPAFLPLIDPIIEYSHALGNVITGGVVYRGTALGGAFLGRYFYADYGSERLWSAFLNVDQATAEATATDIVEHTNELDAFGGVGNIAGFGIDALGEMYLVDHGGGQVKRVLLAASSGGTCTTPMPAPDWVCVGDGWLPPDHPLAGGGGTPPPPGGGTTPPAACSTPMPAPDWVCVGDGWLPPDHPLAGGGNGGGTPPPPDGGNGGTPPPATCTTPMPAPDLVCVGDGWLPPDHPLATGAGGGTPPPSGGNGGTGTPPPAACATPMPAADWVCVGDGWLPPDHPLAVGAGGGTPPPSGGGTGNGATTCTIPDPFVAIGGGVCVNGGWVPRDHPLAGSGTGGL